ncbi:MAG: hypothetical protein HQ518_26920 [Rhodopirellula sp.]|nr:hypothetical protein [Rhodopirellula sp.]
MDCIEWSRFCAICRDSLFGGNGDDTLDGGRDDGMINRQSGNDVLRGGHGDGTVRGSSGGNLMLSNADRAKLNAQT